MARSVQITVDCQSPSLLAHFWAEVLGYRVAAPPGGFATWTEYWLSVGVAAEELEGEDEDDRIEDPEGIGPTMWFQRVPEPKVGKNRLHLDVDVSGGRDVPVATRRERIATAADRVEVLGARRLRDLGDNPDHFVVLADPEGNEFCLH